MEDSESKTRGHVRRKLVIAHRVCPALAKTSIGFTDKLEMVRTTTHSLHEALSGLEVLLVVILDGCSSAYKDVFLRVFADRCGDTRFSMAFVETDAIGNQRTFARQIDILMAEAEPKDFVYFSEDDYLYLPTAFSAMMSALDFPDVDFVTPLDHPDRYLDVMPERRLTPLRVTADCHWRRVSNTCCTFMTTRETLARFVRSVRAYAQGVSDGGMWHTVTKDCLFSIRFTVVLAVRYVLGIRKSWGEFIPLEAWRKCWGRVLFGPRGRLWSPVPTLAVHLCDKSLPPGAHLIVSEAMRDDVRTKEQAYLGVANG